MPPVPGLMQFILASESARRVDLLNSVGYRFQTVKSGFPEVDHEGDPERTVRENARGKAEAVSNMYPSDIVLGADTVVYLPEERETFGQAKEPDDVRRMLKRLQGRAHEVHSGVAVIRGNRILVRHARTEVRMRPLPERDIEAYVTFGEGVGKAGGYAIQGVAAVFVEGIIGDYTNVVGLPLSLAARMLEHVGVGWYE
ncbi:maf: septum formation protein Maf [Rubrobacter radiotolerans]|uniref:dTTP/UTP pyrophosphatase n=1 Tax=Rubrobacter radiotolerans TaxID=42256 RepID=A0A023X3A4_RUBRA|nr:Maf family protein [Rubrobacter radiotolerans]AHY46823.1 maf: septum formation protein Maf [Rubrobacter radiotolerans]MDX5894230.1 Maf family protein [Rubrobacter radiotolerans]SMC05514.1 septum formation protein [Rubrobacter radiotolerans DSM 5868]